jgi:hypothetical protein
MAASFSTHSGARAQDDTQREWNANDRACPLMDVASPRSTDLRTSKEVRGFVENVNRISATEGLEHERINKDGVVIEQMRHKFNDVAEIQETRPGILNMGEYRDGGPGQSGFPAELSTVGITALVLIFHPYHAKEFGMTCEGTENWQGREAWKARFEQRTDQPARMSALRVGDAICSIFLKGTPWIDQQNYQIVHLGPTFSSPRLRFG